MPDTKKTLDSKQLKEQLKKQLEAIEHSYAELRKIFLNSPKLSHPTHSATLGQIMASFLKENTVAIGNYLTKISQPEWIEENFETYQNQERQWGISTELERNLLQPLQRFAGTHINTYTKRISDADIEKIANELLGSSLDQLKEANRLSPEEANNYAQNIALKISTIANQTQEYVQASVQSNIESSASKNIIDDRRKATGKIVNEKTVKNSLKRLQEGLNNSLSLCASLGISTNSEDPEIIQEGSSAFKTFEEFHKMLDRISKSSSNKAIKSQTLKQTKASCDKAMQALASGLLAGRSRENIRDMFFENILTLCIEEDYIGEHCKLRRDLLRYLQENYNIQDLDNLPIAELSKRREFLDFLCMTLLVNKPNSYNKESFKKFLDAVHETLERLNKGYPDSALSQLEQKEQSIESETEYPKFSSLVEAESFESAQDTLKDLDGALADEIDNSTWPFPLPGSLSTLHLQGDIVDSGSPGEKAAPKLGDSSAEQKAEVLEIRIETFKSALKNAEKDNQDLQDQLKEYGKRFEQVQIDKVGLESRLQSQKAEFESRLQESQNTVDQQASKIQEMQMQISEMKNNLVIDKIASAEQTGETKHAEELHALEEENRLFREEMLKSSSAQKERLEALKEEAQQYKEEYEKTAVLLKEKTIHLVGMQERFQELSRENDLYKSSAEQHSKSIEQLEEQIKALEKNLQTSESMIATLKARYDKAPRDELTKQLLQHKNRYMQIKGEIQTLWRLTNIKILGLDKDENVREYIPSQDMKRFVDMLSRLHPEADATLEQNVATADEKDEIIKNLREQINALGQENERLGGIIVLKGGENQDKAQVIEQLKEQLNILEGSLEASNATNLDSMLKQFFDEASQRYNTNFTPAIMREILSDCLEYLNVAFLLQNNFPDSVKTENPSPKKHDGLITLKFNAQAQKEQKDPGVSSTQGKQKENNFERFKEAIGKLNSVSSKHNSLDQDQRNLIEDVSLDLALGIMRVFETSIKHICGKTPTLDRNKSNSDPSLYISPISLEAENAAAQLPNTDKEGTKKGLTRSNSSASGVLPSDSKSGSLLTSIKKTFTKIGRGSKTKRGNKISQIQVNLHHHNLPYDDSLTNPLERGKLGFLGESPMEQNSQVDGQPGQNYANSSSEGSIGKGSINSNKYETISHYEGGPLPELPKPPEGEVVVPTPEGEVVVPTPEGEVVVPTPEGEVVVPTPEGEVVVPTPEGEVVPTPEGEVVPTKFTSAEEAAVAIDEQTKKEKGGSNNVGGRPQPQL